MLRGVCDVQRHTIGRPMFGVVADTQRPLTRTDVSKGWWICAGLTHAAATAHGAVRCSPRVEELDGGRVVRLARRRRRRCNAPRGLCWETPGCADHISRGQVSHVCGPILSILFETCCHPSRKTGWFAVIRYALRRVVACLSGPLGETAHETVTIDD